jgi:RIO-like serine/threonine protein kinase
MSDELRARHARRMAFLRALYDRVDSSVSEFVSAFEIAEASAIERAECTRVVEYLAEKGLILVDDHRAGTIRLTAEGVDRIELAG